MSNDDKKILTKNWISIMLYTGPKNSDELIRTGCKIMVFGWEYDDFIKIIGEMVTERIISKMTDGSFILNEKGLYNVKKNSIVPLLNLCDNSEYVSAFIEKNKENCDYLFVTKLYTEKIEEKRESLIVTYAVGHFDKLATILTLAKEFLANPPSG